ncbi:YceI family protein [Carboxylicivirga marina]|uniref:YceI family protein n=1 Tax=Carboxylicivirga marina TaxID=2800988 RepID=A0ABS1HQN7_9BACT|nr:YceI family protein [Carboxylicivirga marina]MBK3519961.1 YceI family protein [Carboxylicivirga marina]
MKRLLILYFVLCFPFIQSLCIAQSKYKADDGFVSFFSSAPLEDIYAENKTVKSLIDLSTNEIAFIVQVQNFKFKKSLMQKHFNEKYMESHKYPHATFSGFVKSSSNITITGRHSVTVKGEMLIHGVKKTIEVVGVLINNGTSISANSEFIIKVDDYDIKIPKLLVKNIAEEVKVTLQLNYELLK